MAKNKEIEEKKAVENLQNLSSMMASYSGMRASLKNKEDGQLVLNRYYNIIKEIGINISTQNQEFYGNSELSDEFLKDVDKAKLYQKEVFKYYKVDEKQFKKNK